MPYFKEIKKQSLIKFKKTFEIQLSLMFTLRKQRESSCSHLVIVLGKVKVVENFLNCSIC